MNENARHIYCDVAIIGSGPAGLSAAIELKKLGVKEVLVLERETSAGGVPRHCGHPPFGILEYYRPLTGPSYARRLVTDAEKAGVLFSLNTTVTKIHPGGRLSLAMPEAPAELTARHVLITTGIRETPRSARFVSGMRPLGILNTGALQAMVYLKGLTPFQKPLIVGTELVSLSALWTCHKAGIQPVAMLEESDRPTVRWPLYHATRLFGVPLLTGNEISFILGKERVEAVKLADGRELDCDGILFTGRFVPESSLIRTGHLELDPKTGGPVVNQFGQCSDPVYYAAGNVLRPVEHAGWCWLEGRLVARAIATSLKINQVQRNDDIRLRVSPPLRYVMPQKLSRNGFDGMPHVQLRVERPVRGLLVIRDGDKILVSRKIRAIPEQRIVLPVSSLVAARGKELCISIQQ